ncbi:MAG: hypothetical protein JOY55_06780, partial [Mycobacterium sp.]|nr:hypothetical protein [Mycobacterium sp.]
MTTSSQKSLPPDTIDGAPVVVWRPHPARRLAHQAALTGRAVVAARRRHNRYSEAAEQRAGQRLLAQLKELP